VFASADYSGLELHTVAQVCVTVLGQSKLGEVLNAGGDPHLSMAARILGCSYEDALVRKKAHDEETDTARQVGKVANFGFPGGLGAVSMVAFAASNYGVALTEDEARTLKEQWIGEFPEFIEYFRWISKLVDAPFPQIEQIFSGRFRGGVSYTEACNSFFQGLGADAAKAAGFLIAKACNVDLESVLYGSRIVNFVHDEFILEVPEERGHACAIELASLMIRGAAPWLPDVPPRAEPLLMRRWSKKAKPVFVEGRLVPWG
jgi:DNA polymerase-1